MALGICFCRVLARGGAFLNERGTRVHAARVVQKRKAFLWGNFQCPPHAHELPL